MKLINMKEKHEIGILLLLLTGACFLTFYYHILLDTDIVFTHLFYIPIALASIWWDVKGIFVALFLGTILLLSHVFSISSIPVVHDIYRAVIFIVIALALALLSKQAKATEILYKRIANSSPTGIYIVQDGRFRFLNRRVTLYSGYSENEMMQMAALDHIIHPNDIRPARESAIRMLKGELTTPYEFRIVERNSDIRWLMGTATPILYQGEEAVLGNVVDITERKQMEKELEFRNTLLSTQQEAAIDGILVVDENGIILSFNQPFVDMWGIPADVMESKSDELALQSILNKLEAPEEFLHKVKYLYENRQEKSRDEITLKDARTFDRYSAPIHGPDGMYYGRVWYFRDITERKQMEKELFTLSVTDPLTGLHNRRGFITLVEQQLNIAERRKSRMLLYFVDIDDVKWINDNLGHEEGDKALIDTAAILKETFRKSDIIARLGGDEFAILAIVEDEVNRKIMLSRLQKTIDLHNAKTSRHYTISMSMGIAEYNPENPSSIDDLMSRADLMMYGEKRSKKSC